MTPGTVEARGMTFHTLEAGDGPLVVCVHGFPDHARSFRHQLPALAAAGYRAVAPYTRGYAPTDPAPDGYYHPASQAMDVLGIIDALGYDDAVVYGHDWGALAAYGAALAAPERVRKLVSSAVPYGRQVGEAFLTSYDQQRRFWYMFFFQLPLAELAVPHDDFVFIERIWADWSPGWRCPPEEMEAIKATFRKPGVLQAALAYYRAQLGDAPRDPALADLEEKMFGAPIEVPGMMIHGADDGLMRSGLLEGMADVYPKGLRMEIVPGAGHFVHQEKPEVVNRLLLDFLAT